LKTSIHTILAARLGLAALIISSVLAVVVYLSQRQKIGDTILDRAAQGSRLFSGYAAPLLDVPGLENRSDIQRALEEFASTQIGERSGHFVDVRIHGLSGTEVAVLRDVTYGDLGAAEKMYDTYEPPGRIESHDVWYRSKWIGGVPYVVVAAPLENSKGIVVARFSGVYVVSSDAVADVRRSVMRSVIASVVIVLITTALVYPVVALLMRRVTKLTYSLLDSNLETLEVLGSAIAKRDSDTDIHNYRVTIISVRLAEAVDIDVGAIKRLIKGAFLHDVGKIGIRDKVLLKPGPLTDEEFRVMRTHVSHGTDIVERSEWLSEAVDIVGYHHEKFDGSGYQRGLSGNEIPVSARIFAIADVFDALASRRPYKEPFSFDEVMAILEEGRGRHFDPGLLDAFSRIARNVYDELADRDDESLRREVHGIIERYYKKESAVFV
jgi:HD-GYP domain-containing protein (c-di-GMP phosphodiesterase class II)